MPDIRQWFRQHPASGTYVTFCVTVIIILQLIDIWKGG